MTPSRNGPLGPDDRRCGPEIIKSTFKRIHRDEGRMWAEGYKQHDLDLAQETFGLTSPPDLIASLLERRPVLGLDQRCDEEKIKIIVECPLDGLLFDVEQNDLWWPDWGDRPDTAEGRTEVLRGVVKQAPKLVPLVSHRYLPCEPNESGNPVFSIYQSDVIYYGANIADYFEREFASAPGPVVGPIKRIRFGLNSPIVIKFIGDAINLLSLRRRRPASCENVSQFDRCRPPSMFRMARRHRQLF